MENLYFKGAMPAKQPEGKKRRIFFFKIEIKQKYLEKHSWIHKLIMLIAYWNISGTRLFPTVLSGYHGQLLQSNITVCAQLFILDDL